MDETQPENMNTTVNFLRTVLVALCANFNALNIPEGDWECKFRSEYHYQLKSLKGKTLRFTTLQRLPLSGTEINESGEIRGVGIAFDVIHEIQRRVGFYYNITLPKTNAFGNDKSGIMQLLNDREVDMAVAFIPIADVFRKYASFSTALAEFEWVLMMARPSASASGSGLLAPFQGMVWMLIFISLVIAGPTMYLIVYLRSKISKSTAESRNQYTLPACIWFVYGALMKQGSTLSPISDSPRLFFATWWIFITILTSFYTANLTAFLTLSEFTLTIQTPSDIYRHNKKWMADEGGYTQALVTHEYIYFPLTQMSTAQRYFTKETLQGRLQRIDRGTIYITEKKKAQHYMLRDYMNKIEKKVPERFRCTYVLTPKTILSKSVAFGYAKNSSLRSLLDPMLSYFVHGGIVRHLLDENMPLTTICPLNLATRERKLKNSDLITTYKVVGLGFCFSLIAFIGEVIHRMIGKRRSKKRIKKKMDQNNKTTFTKDFSFSKKSHNFKNSSNGDYTIPGYYKNILMPYHMSYKNDINFTYDQDKIDTRFMSDHRPTNFFFQYTN